MVAASSTRVRRCMGFFSCGWRGRGSTECSPCARQLAGNRGDAPVAMGPQSLFAGGQGGSRRISFFPLSPRQVVPDPRRARRLGGWVGGWGYPSVSYDFFTLLRTLSCHASFPFCFVVVVFAPLSLCVVEANLTSNQADEARRWTDAPLSACGCVVVSKALPSLSFSASFFFLLLNCHCCCCQLPAAPQAAQVRASHTL